MWFVLYWGSASGEPPVIAPSASTPCKTTALLALLTHQQAYNQPLLPISIPPLFVLSHVSQSLANATKKRHNENPPSLSSLTFPDRLTPWIPSTSIHSTTRPASRHWLTSSPIQNRSLWMKGSRRTGR